MDRTEIIKDLECCRFGKDEAKCKECNWHPWIKPRCWRLLASNALSLIKELTEENERLRGIGLPDDETYIKLSDAKHAIMNYVGEQTVSKYASSEVCKAVRNGAEGAMNELDYITPANVAPIADTIEDIKLRFAMRFGTYTDKDMTPITEVFRLLYQSQKRCWRRKHRR